MYSKIDAAPRRASRNRSRCTSSALRACRRSSPSPRCRSSCRGGSCCTRSRARRSSAGTPRTRTARRGRCGAAAPSGRPAPRERHRQRVGAQLRPQVVGHAQPTIRRLHRSITAARYSQPSPVGDVRDVARPLAVRRDRPRTPGRARSRRPGARGRESVVRGTNAPPRLHRRAPSCTHQLGDGVLADRARPASFSSAVHARAAVGAAADCVRRADLRRSARARRRAAAGRRRADASPRRSTRCG